MAKSQQKLTDWFSCEIKPVRRGWYDTDQGNPQVFVQSRFRWWWSGRYWLEHPKGKLCLQQNRSWRGILGPLT